MKDLFKHRESDVSPAFLAFLNLLGQKIQLKGWKRYRGDLGVEKEGASYYTEWNGVEVRTLCPVPWATLLTCSGSRSCSTSPCGWTQSSTAASSAMM